MLKRDEYWDQQIAPWPGTATFLLTVTWKSGEISTREAPYAGSVMTALSSLPRKEMEKSRRRPEGREMVGVVETAPSEVTG